MYYHFVRVRLEKGFGLIEVICNTFLVNVFVSTWKISMLRRSVFYIFLGHCRLNRPKYCIKNESSPFIAYWKCLLNLFSCSRYLLRFGCFPTASSQRWKRLVRSGSAYLDSSRPFIFCKFSSTSNKTYVSSM